MTMLRAISAGIFIVIGSAFLIEAAAKPGVKPRPRDLVKVSKAHEKIIEGALKYLASKQKANGSWGESSEERRHPVAVTGYTLMAFQAGGNLPGEGPYGKQVKKGMDYLLNVMGPDGIYGAHASGQYMYGHGIATIALAELYGQTRSKAMRPKLERAIKLIIASQNSQGGWRYRPAVRDADISVTVLQVVALRAAKNGGIDVPQRTIDRAVKYVKACHHPGSGGFSYQPGSSPGYARTAAAIYSLQVCGLYDDPLVLKGSKYLEANHHNSHQWYVYGNFYAAPAQYMIGGKTWERWYKVIASTIVKDVRRTAGSAYYWPQHRRGGVGPIYTTSVFTTMLAMPYHYIPLYQR
jgi:squalene cyclase